MNTPFLDEVYNRVDFDRNLAFKFFTIFSLFEYALKNTQYKHLVNGKVEAKWDEFARDISPTFLISPGSELEISVNYLLNNPPKRQILNTHNRLLFEDPVVRPTNITNDTIWLSLLIRRIRNNLFHGGKFEFDPARDTQLLNHALNILEEWAKLNADLKLELRNVR